MRCNTHLHCQPAAAAEVSTRSHSRHRHTPLHSWCHRFLPRSTQIIGYARSDLDDAGLRERLSPFLKGSVEVVDKFLSLCSYTKGDVSAADVQQHVFARARTHILSHIHTCYHTHFITHTHIHTHPSMRPSHLGTHTWRGKWKHGRVNLLSRRGVCFTWHFPPMCTLRHVQGMGGGGLGAVRWRGGV